ncbi:MAG: serpin family protein [Planctomycetaceae bacterium]|nr:serpin family protein [Planctomycetaceae bacterium]
MNAKFLLVCGAWATLLLIATSANALAEVQPHVRAPLTPAVQAVAVANNGLAFDLFRQLGSEDADENLLISPISISTALTMTYAGARGATAAQMADVLHLNGLADDAIHAGCGGLISDLNAPREGYKLSVANRLFGQTGFPFRQQFLDTLAGPYGAPLEQLDFVGNTEPSREHINDWVADQTNQKIKDLLPSGSITTDTALVLTNAVYFNGAWKNRFDAAATNDAPFYRLDGSVGQASLMYQQNVLNHAAFDDFQMLEIPYAGDDLTLVVMLPNQRDGLAALEGSLDAERFQESVDSMQLRKVDLFLPKFTFRDGASLKAPLEDLGMTDAFGDADFSGISEGGDLVISDVVHKTFIDVNEGGTEAAGATAVIVETTSVNPNPPAFRADHPFLFGLRDAHTGGLLFLGRMTDPAAATAAAIVPEPTATALLMTAIVGLWGHRTRREG